MVAAPESSSSTRLGSRLGKKNWRPSQRGEEQSCCNLEEKLMVTNRESVGDGATGKTGGTVSERLVAWRQWLEGMAGRQDDLQQHVLEAAANAQQRVSMSVSTFAWHGLPFPFQVTTSMYYKLAASPWRQSGPWGAVSNEQGAGLLVRDLIRP